MIEVEEELVRRSQAGEREAFEALVVRTARLVFARLYLDCGDKHLAEDLTQETFLTAWKSIGQVTEARGFRAWLMSIAHSVRIDEARRGGRKKRRGTVAGGREMMNVVGGADPAEVAEREEQRSAALEALRGLPEEYRQPLTLRYLAGADYQEIGRQLALSNGSLRGLLHRGLAMLRERMTAKL